MRGYTSISSYVQIALALIKDKPNRYLLSPSPKRFPWIDPSSVDTYHSKLLLFLELFYIENLIENLLNETLRSQLRHKEKSVTFTKISRLDFVSMTIRNHHRSGH